MATTKKPTTSIPCAGPNESVGQMTWASNTFDTANPRDKTIILSRLKISNSPFWRPAIHRIFDRKLRLSSHQAREKVGKSKRRMAGKGEDLKEMGRFSPLLAHPTGE
jgi:hypothetical protein